MSATRIPLNFFAMPFGLTGLGGVWLTMANYGLAPKAVGNALIVIAALTWLAVLIAYARWVLSARDNLRDDLTDPVGAPFFALSLIAPTLIGSQLIYPFAPITGRVVVDVFVVLTLAFGAWSTGEWIYRPLYIDRIHPGYLLPTVAGGLITGLAAAQVGQHGLGVFMFGIGVVSWFIVGSIVLNRMLFRPLVPTPILPTIAIEAAPAGAASLAYFALHGDQIDAIATIIAGYGLLMALMQLRMIGAFFRLRFMPSFWAFTFSWAVVANTGIHWLNDKHPAGHTIYEYLVLAAITVLVGGIGIRTLMALARHQLPPKPAPAPLPAEPVHT